LNERFRAAEDVLRWCQLTRIICCSYKLTYLLIFPYQDCSCETSTIILLFTISTCGRIYEDNLRRDFIVSPVKIYLTFTMVSTNVS